MKCLKPYDIFISHVAEDKTEVTDSLAALLREVGLRVWYSSDQLVLGESIIDVVEQGLKRSRYAIVVLSKAYTKSPWAIYELYTLIARRNKRKAIVIPVWHEITSAEIKQLFPYIVDTYGLTTRKGIDYLGERLKKEIGHRSFVCRCVSNLVWLFEKYRKLISSFFIGTLIVSILIAVLLYINSFYPSGSIITNGIEYLIQKREKEYLGEQSRCDYQLSELLYKRDEFDRKQVGSNRHRYRFYNGTHEITSKVGIRQLGIPVDMATVREHYGLDSFTICLENFVDSQDYVLSYTFINSEPLKYEVIRNELSTDDEYHVTLAFKNNIRSIRVNCAYTENTSAKRESVSYYGFKSTEKFLFKKQHGEWKFVGYN